MMQTKSVKYTIKGQGLNINDSLPSMTCRSMAELKIGKADVDLVPLMHIITDLKSAKHNLHLMRAIVLECEDFLFSVILSAM